MEIKIPAKVLRAAQLFVSKDETRKILTGARIRWNEEGNWEVTATDSFKLFESWKTSRISQPTGQIVIDLSTLSLKAADRTVSVNTSELRAEVFTNKGGRCRILLHDVSADLGGYTRYPSTDSIIADPFDSVPGHESALAPKHFMSICKATEILGRSASFTLHTPSCVSPPRATRPVVVPWHNTDSELSFHGFGLVMPVRL